MGLHKAQANGKTYRFLLNTDKRINLLYGSAGSGKSWSVAQYLLINKFCQEDGIRLLLTRKTGPHLKKSSWLLMNDLITRYEVPVVRNKTELTITANGNTMFFAPLDDPQKLKSIERPNYVWGEEATEYTWNDYMQLNLRCRGPNPNGKNKLYYSFNPDDEHSFLHDIVDNPPDNVAINHSTYKDNAFLESDYIEELERLKEIDLTYWKIYGEGVWASRENIIYTNWDIIDEWPDEFDEVIYGVDFGVNNPSAIIEIGILDNELYEREVLYETGLSPSMFMDRMDALDISKDKPMYADSSMPGMIIEMENGGWLVYPSKKGQNSVIEGIRKVKNFKKHMHRESVNLIKERKGYKWREDRNGNILDEPVKFRDHAMDGERYAIFTHFDDEGRAAIWDL